MLFTPCGYLWPMIARGFLLARRAECPKTILPFFYFFWIWGLLCLPVSAIMDLDPKFSKRSSEKRSEPKIFCGKFFPAYSCVVFLQRGEVNCCGIIRIDTGSREAIEVTSHHGIGRGSL